MESTSTSSNHRKEAVEWLASSEVFDVKPVGVDAISAISIMGENETLAGNVLRRLCRVGEGACNDTCVLKDGIKNRANRELARFCAERNLKDAIQRLGAKPENVLMVGVTADGIGFADEIDSDPDKYKALSRSPVVGVKELPGFNAFFAREGDKIDGEEVTVLGRRLADCGDVNLEFVDRDGRSVMGFIHMTKPNLQGKGAQRYDYKDEKVGSFEYFMRTALDYYGAHVSTVSVRVAAAIKPEHYVWDFDSEADMDKKGFIGWKDTIDEDGKPLLKNQSNPDWQPGQPFDSSDKWFADFPAMIRWQMAQLKDLKPHQIEWAGASILVIQRVSMLPITVVRQTRMLMAAMLTLRLGQIDSTYIG